MQTFIMTLGSSTQDHKTASDSNHNEEDVEGLLHVDQPNPPVEYTLVI